MGVKDLVQKLYLYVEQSWCVIPLNDRVKHILLSFHRKVLHSFFKNIEIHSLVFKAGFSRHFISIFTTPSTSLHFWETQHCLCKPLTTWSDTIITDKFLTDIIIRTPVVKFSNTWKFSDILKIPHVFCKFSLEKRTRSDVACSGIPLLLALPLLQHHSVRF